MEVMFYPAFVYLLSPPAWGRDTPVHLFSIHFLVFCSFFTFPFFQWL